MSNVFFVGCGPGDPELITVKAKKLIQKADVVVYSGSLIPEPILKLCKKGKLYDAAKLVREEIFDLLYKNAKKDKLVVRLHDGDPAIYGAIREQIDNLEKKGIESTVVPGVTSFLASAAALGTQLTLPGVTQTMIITRAEARTKVPKREQISELAKHQATLIFYLSVHLLNKISKEARKNRLILLGIMTNAGFDFYQQEWWHYQLFNSRQYPVIEADSKMIPNLNFK